MKDSELYNERLRISLEFSSLKVIVNEIAYKSLMPIKNIYFSSSTQYDGDIYGHRLTQFHVKGVHVDAKLAFPI